MIKLAALRSDLIFLETQPAVILKEAKVRSPLPCIQRALVTIMTVYHPTLFKQFF